MTFIVIHHSPYTWRIIPWLACKWWINPWLPSFPKKSRWPVYGIYTAYVYPPPLANHWSLNWGGSSKEGGDIPWWDIIHPNRKQHVSHEKKKNILLSIESWLVYRDPYNGFWNNPYIYNWVGFHPLYILTNQVFFIAHVEVLGGATAWKYKVHDMSRCHMVEKGPSLGAS